MATTVSFPSSPTLNQTYTYGSVTWKYDGTKWIVVGYAEYVPENDSVTYAKIATDLKGSQVIGASEINWSLGGIFSKTISGNTTFTFSNLQVNKVISIILTGNFTVAWPSYMNADHLISGVYDGTKVNYIQVHCTNATSGSEKVWWLIKTVGV
jgi:hypothetical protein